MRVRSLVVALMLTAAPAFAGESAVTPAPTPPPAAGPTRAAAEGFCGEAAASAKDLIARYTTNAGLKQVYKSGQYLAYADSDKEPTVMYTLTTDSNPAHPAAVCRRTVKEGDNAVIKMNIVCDGNADECKKLSNEFTVMTMQMQQEVEKKMKGGAQ